ncbi:SET domain-containing protein [Durotheca rogersii]|uniref:SET domain-containing protein n=1 Tax=Durotheca rogersii TaxID=419775 RepID=UPI00221EFD05|nr:SET domain-containing protein [Durotheca rogersii]KAI5864110.1 SET domain-containing protein [Durotheca rogersii]
MATAAERYDALLRWVEEGGGNLNSAVEIYHDEVTKGSFRVRDSCAIGVDDTVVTLPLSKTLSYLNAIDDSPNFAASSPPPQSALDRGSSACFPAEFLKDAPPHVVGRFFLIQQYLLGSESRWWPYIRTLPQPEHLSSSLPALWPAEDVEFLQGTNAFVAVEDIKSTLKREYKEALKLLPESYRLEYTRLLYHWAYSIFTSRSFRPSLILPSGMAPSVPCDLDDFSILLPLYDIGNHSPLAKIAWATDEKTQLCMLRSRQTYSAGQQVFNNYGMKTNAELLLGYGFTLPEDETLHNDYVHIRTKADLEAGDLTSTHLVSLRPFVHPSSFVGRSKLLSADSMSCLPCFSHIQDSLISVLYEAITRASEETGPVSLAHIMRGDIPEEVLTRIVDSLGSKLSIDLNEIEVNDPEYEAVNRNQQLAVQYREQCQKVLRNALRSLMAADD